MPTQPNCRLGRVAVQPLWSDALPHAPGSRLPSGSSRVVGVLEGEGIGKEVIRAALRVLSAVEAVTEERFEIRTGGPIGFEAEARCGAPLSEEVVAFCDKVFADGGAVLAGPGGGRFVYDLRKRFDLFCKFSPLQPSDELQDAGRLKPEYARGVDILVIRENVGGVYQGQWAEHAAGAAGRRAEHSFAYKEADVRRILEVATRVAAQRRGEMSVVLKDGGIPTISGLWRACALDIAAAHGITCSFVNVDLIAYRLIQDARDLDLIVTPNLFGDVLADLGAVLLGSRGLSFSGNFSATGAAVYQTNHGAAYDLAGADQANPVGQILSLAMLLRESFAMTAAADLIEAAVSHVWRRGWRTADLCTTSAPIIGTREMAERVADAVITLSGAVQPHEASAPAD